MTTKPPKPGARTGEWIAGFAGLALVVLTFLPWFEPVAPGPNASIAASARRAGYDSLSAWQAFGLTDVLLVALGLGAIAVLVIALTAQNTAAPVASCVVVGCAGFIVVVIAFYRVLLNQPGPNAAVELRPAAYIGLVAALLAWAGTWMALRDETTPGVEPVLPPAQPAPPAVAPS